MSQTLWSEKRLLLLVACVDMFAAATAYVGSFELVAQASRSLGASIEEPRDISTISIGVAVIAVLFIRRLSSSAAVTAGVDFYASALKSCFAALLAASFLAFMIGADARWLIGANALLLPLTMVASRWATRQVVRLRNRNADLLPTALLVGVQPELESTLKQETSIGYQPSGITSVASSDELASAIHSMSAAAVILDRHAGSATELRELVWRADELGCKVILTSPVGMATQNEVIVLPTATHDLTVLSTASLRLSARYVKRMFDLLVTPIVVFFAAPVLILGVVLVALLDGFPVWYRATRVGAGGKPFTMYKIRTMRPISEFRENHETIGDKSAMSSIKAESVRVTRVGRVLRRWSIDELPQLFHVVAGTMSLVGPRPRLLDEHSENALLLRRLKVKPGLTGLWQVSGRGDVPLNEAAELDVRYVDSWSLFGDVVILIRTLKTVVTGRGAR